MTWKRGDVVHITHLPVGAWFKAHDLFWRIIRLNGCTPDVERFSTDPTDTVRPYDGPALVEFDEVGDPTRCLTHHTPCCLPCAAKLRQRDVDRTIDAIRRHDEKEVMAYLAALPPDARHLTVTFWEPLARQGTISVSIGDAFEARNEGGLLASLAAAVRALPKEK